MEFCSAMRTAGRMRPAAHPQIEFTTTIVVPGRFFTARSTSSGVLSSSIPRRVSSSRIGTTIISGYMDMSVLFLSSGVTLLYVSSPSPSGRQDRPCIFKSTPMLLRENIPLAPLTTFRLGGPARFFVEGRTVAEIQEAVAFSQSNNLPLFVLGGGSNLVVADSGWPGLVLKVAIPGIDQRPGTDDAGKVLFDAGAGESWDRFVSHAVIAHCAGVECLSGIPGSVGGTPVQNVGAYG